MLGALGAKAILVSDAQRQQNHKQDTTSPKNSAVLRDFLVYLTLIAGVLVLGDNPATPTQIQYVRLAGLMSLAGFVVNYSPTIFGQLLERAGGLIERSAAQSNPKGGTDTTAVPPG